MQLTLATHQVRDVRFGDRTRLDDGTLEIDADALRQVVVDGEVIEDASIALARPGEPVRIVHVLDTVEPRIRTDAEGGDFPGVLSSPRTVGEGTTHRLGGVAVMQSALVPVSVGGLNVKEAIVNMSGPGAALTPFSRTLNVVLALRVREGLPYARYDGAIRVAGLRAAVCLAEAARQATPDAVERCALAPRDPRLPTVVYVCLLMQEGDVHHVFVYGRHVDDTPSLLHPNELLDGAIVNGAHHSGYHRNPTYLYQNHPVIQELYRRQGQELNFGGVVIMKCLNVSSFDKERAACYAAKLARLMGADGVVITGGTGGHGVLDLMLACREAERIGLKAALTCFEVAGDGGQESGLVSFVPEADAVVSTGNIDEVVELPRMERVIGGQHLFDIGNYEAGAGAASIGPFRTALRRVYCCSTMSGAGHLTARDG